jgi:transposase
VLLDPRDALIAELTRRLEETLAKLGAAEKRIAELESRLRQNSRNSSKPPSSDPPGIERPKSEGSERKRGGQPGHEPSRRELHPPERVDRVEDHWPAKCEHCQEPLPRQLRTEVGEPTRHQVTEMPQVRAHLTEHRLHAQHCDGCGHTTEASLPAGVESGAFGPRLRALVALLAGRYRVSKRMTRELLGDVLGIELSLGSVCNIEQQVSTALAAPVEEAREYVRQQLVVHADETGWREDKRRAWLWTAASPSVTVFRIARSRGADVSREMLGEGFAGFLVSDRWNGYNWLELRQLCWSHLKRDFEGFVDRGGEGARVGNALLEQVGELFHLYHRARDGTLSRSTFRSRMKPIEQRVSSLLTRAAACPDKTTSAKALEIKKLARFLWTFVDVDEVPPTNNAAERAIRPAVLWRKGSFGTDSARGSRFVERILTAVATLRQQGRHVLEYLAGACESHALGGIFESLLPAAS